MQSSYSFYFHVVDFKPLNFGIITNSIKHNIRNKFYLDFSADVKSGTVLTKEDFEVSNLAADEWSVERDNISGGGNKRLNLNIFFFKQKNDVIITLPKETVTAAGSVIKNTESISFGPFSIIPNVM